MVKLGPYITQNQISHNTIYTTYLGVDDNEQRVFIELLNSDQDAEVQAFQQRVTQLQQIEAITIPEILASGVNDLNQPYVVYDSEGGDLLSVFFEENFSELPELTVLKIGEQLSQQLSYLEKEKLAHIDLRPENIILKPDHTVSLIGLATPHTLQLENRPFSQQFLDYASPEQIDGKAPTNLSNIFSIGAVLYTFFAGHLPKYQVTNWDIFSQGDDITFETLDNVSKTLNPHTYQIVRKCLARKPWSRYDNSGELTDSIQRAIRTIESKPVEAKKSAIPVNLPKDNRILYGTAALVAALIVIGALALFRNSQNRSILSNIEETPAGLTTIEETAESPEEATNTPRPPTSTPVPNEATLLQPPEEAELSNLDQLTFAWSWPRPLAEGDQFVLIVKSGNQIVYQTEVQEPISNSRFQHTTPIDTFANASGEYNWQVILQGDDGSTKYSAPNGTFFVMVSTPTATPTDMPTATPTLTPTVTNTPEPTDTPTPEACVPNMPTGWVSYSYQAGDTLFNLAIETGTTVERIEEVSCISSSSLRVGTTVFLPSLPATATPSPAPTTPSTSGDGGGSSGGGGNDGGGGGGGGSNPSPPNTPTPPGLP